MLLSLRSGSVTPSSIYRSILSSASLLILCFPATAASSVEIPASNLFMAIAISFASSTVPFDFCSVAARAISSPPFHTLEFPAPTKIRRAPSVRELAGRTDLGAALLSLEVVPKGTAMKRENASESRLFAWAYDFEYARAGREHQNLSCSGQPSRPQKSSRIILRHA